MEQLLALPFVIFYHKKKLSESEVESISIMQYNLDLKILHLVSFNLFH